MRSAGCDIAGREQKGIVRFVKRVSRSSLPPLWNSGSTLSNMFLIRFTLALFFDLSQVLAQQRTILVFTRTNKSAKCKVFFR